MSPLCLVYHQDYLASYYTSTVECPARVKAIHAKLANHFPIVEVVPAEREDILRVDASLCLKEAITFPTSGKMFRPLVKV